MNGGLTRVKRVWLDAVMTGAIIFFSVVPVLADEVAGMHELVDDSRFWSLYRLHCSGCHSTDGSSVPLKGVPDLRLSGQYAITPLGRQYLVQVPGVAQSHLDDETLAELLNWSLWTFSSDCLPREFKPFVAEEIKAWRGSPASDSPKMQSEAQDKKSHSPCDVYTFRREQ